MFEINKILRPKSEEEILQAMNDSGLSPDKLLLKSAQKGFLKGVQVALEKGADVHADNDYALILASQYGFIEIVKMLLEAGADVHAWNDWAIFIASNNGHLEVVNLLKQYYYENMEH